ncbi:KGG domain-containing protein, partial [Bacillus atrophaeus]|nr:stress-induced protein, KGG, repeat-containing protein [Bacillus atrophaeus]
DKEFYQEIGEKGGEATSKNHDKEFYQEIGSKGGNNNNRND